MPQATIKLRGDVRSARKGMQDVSDDVKKVTTNVDRLDGRMQVLGDSIPGAGKALGVFTKAGVAGLAIAAVSELASKVADLSKESLEVQAAFNNLQFGIKGAGEAARGLVDDFSLAQSQVKALELGAISNKEQFEQLIEAGAILGVTMQGSASKGVDDLTTALARQSPKILDNLGLNLTLTQATEELEAQAKAEGRTLTELEKSRAFQTIALQKAVKAARAKNIEDGAALKIQQELVALENLRLRALGGQVSAQTAVNEVILAMGDSIATIDVAKHGDDMKRFERVLREYGKTVSDVGGAQAIQNQVIKAQNKLYEENARKAEAAAEAAAKADWTARLKETKAITQEAKFQMQLSQAYGMSEEAIFSQKRAILIAERESLTVEKERTEEAKQQLILNDQAMQILDATEATRIRVKKFGGGGKGKSAKARREEAEAEAADRMTAALERQRLVLERNIETAEAYGVATWDAREALILFDEANGDRADKEQAQHDLFLLRLEERAEAEAEQARREEELQKKREKAIARTAILLEKRDKEEAKRKAKLAATTDRITARAADGATSLTSVIVDASKKRGEAARQEIAEYAKGQQRIMIIAAAKHLALGIAASVTYRPIKAAAEFTAAGIAGGQAAAFGVTAAALGGASQSGEDSISSASLGSGSIGSPSTAGQTQGNDSAGTAPVSPLEEGGSPVGSDGDTQKQGGTTIIVQGSVIDGGQLKEITDNASTGTGTGFKGGIQ